MILIKVITFYNILKSYYLELFLLLFNFYVILAQLELIITVFAKTLLLLYFASFLEISFHLNIFLATLNNFIFLYITLFLRKSFLF